MENCIAILVNLNCKILAGNCGGRVLLR